MTSHQHAAWPTALDLSLHHVAVVVADLDGARDRYLRLGLRDPEQFDVPEQQVRVIVFQTGTGYLELIQPTDPEGPIARYLDKRGEGMHHVAYRVHNLETTLVRLAAAGVRLIDEQPRRGLHDWRIAFIHPESCAGVLVELVEEPT